MKAPRLWGSVVACLALSMPAAAYGETQRPWPDRLAVDFLNRDQQSFSLAVGALHGVVASMDFAVIDPGGRQIALFYPDEIRPERFWSSPLPIDLFERIAVGQAVARVSLSADEAGRLRQDGATLKHKLDLARRKEALRRLREDLADLDERIDDLRVLGVRLAKNRGDLEGELAGQRMAVQPRIADYEAQINDLMAEWTEKDEDRRALLERRDALLRRSSPPQSELDRLNRDIEALDRRLAPLQVRLRDLWDQRQKLLDSVGTRTLQRLEAAVAEEADNQASIAELEIEKRDLAGEIETQERELAEMEKAAP